MAKKIKLLYKKIVEYLYSHKFIALFLSHGGLHILVLIIIFIVSILLYSKIINVNTHQLRSLEIEICDTLHNYDVSQMTFNFDISTDNENNPLHCFLGFGYIKREKNIINKICLSYDSVKGKTVDLVSRLSITSDEWESQLFSNPIIEKEVYLHNYKTDKIIGVDQQIFPSKKKAQLFSIRLDGHYDFIPNIKQKGLLKNHGNENPYYNIWLGINILDRKDPHFISYINRDSIKLDSTSVISVKINSYERIRKGKNPVIINKIIPEPTNSSLFVINYQGEQLKDVIENGGIYIDAEDKYLAEKANKLNIFFTVIIGTLIAFALDIIVNLILKWRKLKKQEE